MIWYYISLLLCFVGFLKEIRPSEPFVSDYMQEPYRNVTYDELNRYIYPIATYSNLILSVVVLLVTDFLRYKAIIILMGVTGIVTWSLLLWTTSFLGAQLIEVFYALYACCEVAYFAYIYAKVSKEHFLAVSSHTRAALLVGRCTSAQIAATSVAVFLPRVNESIYFYRNQSSSANVINESRNSLNCDLTATRPIKCDKCQQAFTLMFKQLKCAYSNRNVVLWSIWYAAGMCVFVQYLSYVQLIWIKIDNRPELMWNGAIEATAALLSATVALLASRMHTNFINTKFKVLAILCALSFCASAAIFLTANASHRFESYAGYLIFYMFYTFTITISSAEIAKELPEDSYGMIFGVNTFFAYCLQSILTAIVVSDAFGLGLNIFQQMNIYAGFLGFIGLIYFLLLLVSTIRSIDCTNSKPNDSKQTNSSG